MTPNALPGLSIAQSGSSIPAEPSKRKTAPEVLNDDDTNAKKAKPDSKSTDKSVADVSDTTALTDDLETVITGITERLGTIKLLLGQGNFSDVRDLAKHSPGLLKSLRTLDELQKDRFGRSLQKSREAEEEAARQEQVRIDREESLRARLADNEATAAVHATDLETLLRDVSGVLVFDAMLNDDEVTVTFTTMTKSWEAIVTIHYSDRRKVVWRGKLDECLTSVISWDWILCLDQGPGRLGIHLHYLREEDVPELPASLRRDVEWGACYCP
ncbi:MAG: hypothetical protein ALECFALPRED_003448 [Alectoria fallacina]|uniref:Uncharacterized protein n=1 Tax=Alectoria fallacina TaxID=1903189 RepID=A0A8H3FRD3_9LECA|nr:MAG: hypothetical protein ALECFALPRED_003448 [Alectoria fallacina]